MTAPPERLRSVRSVGILVLLAALSFLLPGLGLHPVQREQELRVALTARPMAEGESWLLPSYLGDLRIRKPPLMYWAVAASYEVGGRTNSPGLARLPSALAGAGLVLLVYLSALRGLGRRRALFAALVCASNLIFLRQARLAETDILLAFFVALATICGHRGLQQGAALPWMALAGIASGLGFMTKGPAALAIPPVIWLVLAIWNPRTGHRAVSPRGAVARGALWLAITVLVAAPWYIYLAVHAGSLAQLRAELSATFSDETAHPGSVFYYIYTLLHAFAPWSLLLPFALATAWRAGRGRRAARFALVWFVVVFALLSLTPSKQIHYALLLVAPASLLTGWYLGRARSRFVWVSRRFFALVFAIWVVHLSAAFWLANREPRAALVGLLRAHGATLQSVDRVLLVGRHRGLIEFYAGRPILDMDSAREAWRHSRPGDLIVLNTRNAPLPEPPGPVHVLGEAGQGGLRSAIWLRE
ncbi:MAG TPA: glycosyltransferase family 39 protein [Kiritimatiellia bacterium]|nr:glycosyltransferase family 39 protein [Kiritimatiellia bacterium]